MFAVRWIILTWNVSWPWHDTQNKISNRNGYEIFTPPLASSSVHQSIFQCSPKYAKHPPSGITPSVSLGVLSTHRPEEQSWFINTWRLQLFTPGCWKYTVWTWSNDITTPLAQHWWLTNENTVEHTMFIEIPTHSGGIFFTLPSFRLSPPLTFHPSFFHRSIAHSFLPSYS